MTLTLARTRSFRNLQSSIGNSTYRLNTIFVGLQHVASGADKENGLPISWSKPSIEKADQVANQARIFACSGALALAHDSFDNFIRDITSDKWLNFSKKTVNIATKAVKRNDDSGGDYSMAERVNSIYDDLELDEPVNIAALELFAKWRNMVVHDRKRKSSLSHQTQETLESSKDYFHKNYSHLRISLAVENFNNRKPPVPKEVTSLIALVQNISRGIDETAIRRVASTPEEFEHTAFVLLGDYFRQNLGRHKSVNASVAELWQGQHERREKNLEKSLASVGISKHKEPISADLPCDFIQRTAMLSVDELLKKIHACTQ